MRDIVFDTDTRNAINEHSHHTDARVFVLNLGVKVSSHLGRLLCCGNALASVRKGYFFHSLISLSLFSADEEIKPCIIEHGINVCWLHCYDYCYFVPKILLV